MGDPLPFENVDQSVSAKSLGSGSVRRGMVVDTPVGFVILAFPAAEESAPPPFEQLPPGIEGGVLVDDVWSLDGKTDAALVTEVTSGLPDVVAASVVNIDEEGLAEESDVVVRLPTSTWLVHTEYWNAAPDDEEGGEFKTARRLEDSQVDIDFEATIQGKARMVMEAALKRARDGTSRVDVIEAVCVEHDMHAHIDVSVHEWDGSHWKTQYVLLFDAFRPYHRYGLTPLSLVEELKAPYPDAHVYVPSEVFVAAPRWVFTEEAKHVSRSR